MISFQLISFCLSTGSLEALTIDIQGLRKGLELAKFERERQMNNPVIGISFPKKLVVIQLSNIFSELIII